MARKYEAPAIADFPMDVAWGGGKGRSEATCAVGYTPDVTECITGRKVITPTCGDGIGGLPPEDCTTGFGFVP